MLLENAKGDFIYLDPPNTVLRVQEHILQNIRLTDFPIMTKQASVIYRQLTNTKCKVMLTNSNTPLVRELYAEF